MSRRDSVLFGDGLITFVTASASAAALSLWNATGESVALGAGVWLGFATQVCIMRWYYDLRRPKRG